MRKKKIICTVTNDLSYDQRMQRICASLAQAGYEVELVGRQRSSSVPLREQPFRQTRLRCRWEKGKLFYLEYNIRLFFYLLFSRFGALWSVDLDTIVPVWAAGRLKSATLIFDAHEYFEEVPEVVRRPRIQRIWKAVARWFIPRMDRRYTVGPALAERFEALYGKPFGVVRNLPYRQEEEALERTMPEKPVFLYQGVLNEGRGLEALIGVMPSFPKAELWLAGEGDMSDALRQMVQAKGLAAQVRFLGYVQPADLPALTKQATIGFNLLENKGLSYYYSLANKAFDYIQAGLPSVQMDFPEYRSLQEEYRVFQLVADLSQETLIVAIRQLLEDKAYYGEMSRRCLSAAAALCWEREEGMVEEAINTPPS